MRTLSRFTQVACLVSFGALAIAAAGCSGEAARTITEGIDGIGGGAGSIADGSTTGVGGGSTTTTTTSSASSGAGGAASSGAGGAPADDACPGEAHQLGIGSLTLDGSTVGAANNYDPSANSCFGAPDASGADVVFAVTFTEAGTLTASLASSIGLAGILYAQTTCGDNSSIVICNKADTWSQMIAVAKDQTMYFIVDGDAGTSGNYHLQLTLAAAACGDGVVNAGEACDDGNTLPGDGCSATCTLEAPTDTSDACPGDVVNIDPAQVIDIKDTMAAPLGSSTTLNYTDKYTTCDGIVDGSPTGTGADQNGNDRVFQFVPSADGTLTLQLRNIGENGGFDGMLSAWANTCSPTAASANFNWTTGLDPANGDYKGCSDHAYGDQAWNSLAPNDPMTQESLSFAVTAGTPYFVVVDGYAGYSAGKFWLHATLQ